MTAQRNDPLRQSARRYDSCLLSKLFLDPVYHAVDAGRIAIESAALHTFNRILADQALWRIKADARKLGSPAGQGIHRYTYSRQNHAADVLLVLIHHTDGGCRSHIDQNERHRIPVDSRDGADDQIGTDGGRIVHQHFQTDIHIHIDDQGFLPRHLADRLPEFSEVVSLEGVADTKKKSVPIIALPTTAGTAAEVTINYVITDEQNQKKMVCVDPNDIPSIAIVDAELMYTLPKSLTAATGLDALTHAIEGLITKGAWEMSDMFEIKAIEMINRYLVIAVEEPSNAEARNGMAVAQYIAGMAFSNVGLGVVHGMAHPLGAIFDVPHGVANALLLPIIMEFNAPAALDKYVEIAKATNVYSTDMTKEKAAEAAVEAVKTLSLRVNIPQHLSDLGIQESDLDRLATAAFADVCTPGNPREVTKEIILDLYKKAL